MIEDSPWETFEPLETLDISCVPTRSVEESKSLEPNTLESPNSHSPTEPESSPIPVSVPNNFPRFSQVYSRRKVTPKLTQVQESNSDPGNEITVRFDPPLQPIETSSDPTDDLPMLLEKVPENALNDHSTHYLTMSLLNDYHQSTKISL